MIQIRGNWLRTINVIFSSEIMAFLADDRRHSLTSLYEKIYKEDESENLWASLLKEVAENKHNSLPTKNLLVLGIFRMQYFYL